MLRNWILAGVAVAAASCPFVYSSEGRAGVSVNVGVEGGIKAPADGKITVNFFYDSLAPYGTWVQDQKYGWVWQPEVAVEVKEWRPYFNDGHWVLTDQGWFWQSNYDWGWISFHYGRWYLREDKWVWVPDTTWAPAWVAWRESDEVFGWAPLTPEVQFDMTSGLAMHQEFPADYFVFVPARSFLSVNLVNVAMPRAEVRTVFNRTQIVKNAYVTENNRVVNRGIPAERVTKATGHKVDTVKLADANVQGGQAVAGERMQGNQLMVYRPQVSKDSSGKSEPSAAARESKEKKQTGKMNTADSRNAAGQDQKGQKSADTQRKDDRSQAKSQKGQQPMNTSADRKQSDRPSATDSPDRSHAPNAPKSDAAGRDNAASQKSNADQKSNVDQKSSAEKKSGMKDQNQNATKPSDRSNDRSAIDRHEPAMNTNADQKSSAGDRMMERSDRSAAPGQGDPRRNNPSINSSHQAGKPDVTPSQGQSSGKAAEPSSRMNSQNASSRDSMKDASPGRSGEAPRSPAASSAPNASPNASKGSSSDARGSQPSAGQNETQRH